MTKPKLICVCGTEIELEWNRGSNSNDDYQCKCPRCGKSWAIEDCTKWADDESEVE